MKLNHALLAAAALGAVIAPNANAAVKKHTKHHAKAVAHGEVKESALRNEVDELKAQVAALRDELRSQRDTTVATQTQVAQTQAQVGEIHQEIAAKPAVTPEDVHVAVKTEVASAVEKEHHNDAFYFKGVKIVPGGFLELTGIYRNRNQTNDIATSFSGVPFPNAHNYYLGETRFTGRQSRLSFLAEGKVSDQLKASMYGEFDFQGAAQTANSNESNSYNPRIRHLWGALDWTGEGAGWHLMAGQNWSLVTLNGADPTSRKHVTPLQIDAQYVVGFNWARQPQVRLTADFLDHHVWIAASAENPATTFGGAVPATVTNVVAGSSGFNSANNLSINTLPDFVEKVGIDEDISGHALHLEGYAIERTFNARVNGIGNSNKGSLGFGGGATLQVVPKLIDVQFSGMGGKGIGRYGSGQLPDVTFDADGSIHPIKEVILLGGVVLHSSKTLDFYGYAGEELQHSNRLSGTYGLGNLAANDSGCYIEGGTCAGNTRRLRELTFGAWQTIFSGSFGHAQVGAQYEYLQRQLFSSNNPGGMPQTDQNIGMISFRYYPFN
jgi:hypothetical protein